jgi:MFS family permease
LALIGSNVLGNGLLSPAYRRLTVGILMVSTFIAFEQMSVAAALPAVLRHLGGVSLYGWVFSAFMLGQVVGIIVAGPAVDRIGLSRPLLLAGIAFCVGLLIDGTAPSMLVLVVGRAIQGVGAGVIVVTLNSAVGRLFPEDLRPRAFAAMAMAWVLPSIVGPAVAGIVAQDLTWRAVFLGVLPAVVVGLAIAVPALSAGAGDRGAAAAAADPGGSTGWLRTMSLALVLVSGVVLALSALGSDQLVVIVGLGIVGVAVLIVGIRRVLPRSKVGLAADQRRAMIIGGLAAAAFFGVESFLPLALTSFHHRSLAEAGTVLTVAAVAWTAGSWAQVRTRDRLGPRGLCVIGLVLIAVGVLGILWLDWQQTPWWVAFGAWTLAPAGMGVITTTTTLVVVSDSDGGPVGEPVAALEVLVTLGTAISAGVGGAALAWSVRSGHNGAQGLRLFDALAAGAALLGLVAAAMLPGPTPRATQSPEAAHPSVASI